MTGSLLTGKVGYNFLDQNLIIFLCFIIPSSLKYSISFHYNYNKNWRVAYTVFSSPLKFMILNLQTFTLGDDVVHSTGFSFHYFLIEFIFPYDLRREFFYYWSRKVVFFFFEGSKKNFFVEFSIKFSLVWNFNDF